ncbi:adenylosuccinate lyase [Dictyoglomus thermophilum]|uniref:Adenylosuccinate lyase n=2 Tax=Dictyoglomus thermophilum TaxID=14 RepID=B5YF29_DICT6|nr:adenylosuccinate lyase [Dictyoglomus thermophilum]ACI20068.1 adenylosuccinate lyase [Dictyoglomus thermophilum H-6-12]MCX7719945.1 adenylosuccinate lyase [Dictyoglomus thermophilum]TYT22607.1 adenylosuccinate lyase [Dictyoglomus thermophilum]
MLLRYSRKELRDLWSDEHRYALWWKVEEAVLEARARLGEIPFEVLKNIKERVRFSVEEIREIEKENNHEMIAFLTNVAQYVGEGSEYIHQGLTSSDVMDTAFSLQIIEALNFIEDDLIKLMEEVKKKAIKYKDLPMMGRTHGMHAEPITLGFKFLGWWAELKRDLERLKKAKENISFGKFSGVVGTLAHLSPKVEEEACKILGLRPEPVATQVIPRDRHAEVIYALSMIASTCERMALEIRHLQRTEVGELEEPFREKQKGSSAMPHKRNPVLSERICGLSRVIRGYISSALENIPLWHERDISHSSVERVIFPDATSLTDYILNLLIGIVRDLRVNEERIRENMMMNYRIYYSQNVLLALTEKGVLRDVAYVWIQEDAFKAMEQKRDFMEIVLEDSRIREYLSREEIERCFSPEIFLKNIDVIFERSGIYDS